MDAERVVRILEMLANRSGGDPEGARYLRVRLSLGDELENLALAWREAVQPARHRRGQPSAGCISPKLPQAREQEVEHGAIALAKAAIGAVELQAGVARAPGIDPEPDHVLDSERPRNLLVEPEAVELAPGEVVGELPGSVGRREEVMRQIALVSLAHGTGHHSPGLAHEDARGVAQRPPLVVGDDVTGNESPEPFEHDLWKRIRPLDLARLTQHLENFPVVGLGEPGHRAEDTTNDVWPKQPARRIIFVVKALGRYFALAGLLAALVLVGCGGGSTASTTAAATTSAPASSTQSAAGAPVGDPAPAELQGTWVLASKHNPEKGLKFVISERHYRVPTRLAHGDLVVNGNEIAFFNAQICGLQLPDGVGRYRWAIRGDFLHFEVIGEDRCGGRSDILDNVTYKRTG